jgi:hypothetical protein
MLEMYGEKQLTDVLLVPPAAIWFQADLFDLEPQCTLRVKLVAGCIPARRHVRQHGTLDSRLGTTCTAVSTTCDLPVLCGH